MRTAEERYDTIRLRHWSLQARIGAYEGEQDNEQELRLDVRLRVNTPRASRLDSLDEAVDYAQTRAAVEGWIAGRRWRLLETFAEDLCEFLLQDPRIRSVKATVEKPAAQTPVLVSYTLVRVNSTH